MFLILLVVYSLFPIGLFTYIYKSKTFPQLERYVTKVSITSLVLDYFIKLIGTVLLSCDILDDDSFFLFLISPIILECILIYILNKSIGPNIDSRNIRKERKPIKWSKCKVIFVFLILFNPLYTIELYLQACGFDGIVNYFNFVLYNLPSNLEPADINNIENFTISLVIGLFIYIVCLVLIVFSLLNVKKQNTNRGITITDISSNISPIVFLRSFELNKSSLSGLTFDEYLCNGFPIKEQPIISLADPDVAFTDGSIKLQAKDSTWKDVIIELFTKCKAVVMFEGKSDGLNWEIDNIRKYIPHNRFFIATPPDEYRVVAWVTGDLYNNTSTRFIVWWTKLFSKKSIKYAFNFIWKNFSERLNIAGVKLPKSEPGSGCLISFDENWNIKYIYNEMNGSSFYKKILDIVPNTNTIFDYDLLSQDIKEYEVDGTITNELLNKCHKFSNVILLIQFALTVMMIIISIYMLA